jgi:hypothetical protein
LTCGETFLHLLSRSSAKDSSTLLYSGSLRYLAVYWISQSARNRANWPTWLALHTDTSAHITCDWGPVSLWNVNSFLESGSQDNRWLLTSGEHISHAGTARYLRPLSLYCLGTLIICNVKCSQSKGAEVGRWTSHSLSITPENLAQSRPNNPGHENPEFARRNRG